MKQLNPEYIQSELEKKHKKRQKSKYRSMKVTGASVKKLQRIIIQRAYNKPLTKS